MSWLRTAVGVLTAVLAVAGTSPAQDQPSGAGSVPTLHVNVHLVDVFASVTTREGAPVANLTKDDFALFEDGKAQRIAVFERDTSAPLSVVLAVDTSGSVRKDFAAEQQAARQFVHALLRPQDQMDVMEFSDSVRELVGFTNNERRITNGLASFRPGSGTAFYSGIYLGSQNLGPQHGRKVLVVISDGGNTVGGTTYEQALEESIRDEVMIYSIIDVPIAASAGRDLGGEHAMITLAEQTGGRYFYADQASLPEIFRRISDDLRTQYLLGYYPSKEREGRPDGDKFRSIAVKLQSAQANARYIVRNRPGYYPSSSPQ